MCSATKLVSVCHRLRCSGLKKGSCSTRGSILGNLLFRFCAWCFVVCSWFVRTRYQDQSTKHKVQRPLSETLVHASPQTPRKPRDSQDVAYRSPELVLHIPTLSR